MPIRKLKPTTPGSRQLSYLTFEEVTKTKPEKKLTIRLKRRAGRNNQGKITTRHHGGGHKRLYRMIDFNQIDKKGIEGKVAAIEYDPYRTAYIMLVNYRDGDKRYHIAPEGIKVGTKVMMADKAKLKKGSRCMIKNIPVGFMVHNIEVRHEKGGQLIRSAGSYATVVSHDDAKFTQVGMPSGEVRHIDKRCFASVGIVSNIDYAKVSIGKAGRKRHMGIKPTVRGKVMNPVDHPHGGGEGCQPIGLPHPKTPWGMPALGFKTRKRKYSDRLIVKSRHRNKK
ncbi:50S ribosomal protein L2 [Candidatus Peregrinibacteria bacterium]|nr:50S ribosomal protein L2 [Candidatus Peregrinibacteria bacterium]